MFRITACVLVLLFIELIAPADVAPKCPESVALTDAHKLRNKLFCGYEKRVRPVKVHTNVTDVNIFMSLRTLEFYEQYNSLNVHSFMKLTWKDEHLSWNKTDEKSLNRITIPMSKIWIPDINLFDKSEMHGEASPMSYSDTMLCRVSYTGIVQCYFPSVLSVFCKADVTRWPVDFQNCDVNVGHYYRSFQDINLTMNGSGLTKWNYMPNREWELLNLTAANVVRVSYNSDFGRSTVINWVAYTFQLKRHSGGLIAIVTIPAFILSAITLAGFCLTARSNERLGLICTNIVCHCLYLCFLGIHLPSNGDTTPFVLLFFRDSLLLASVSLIVTLVVRRLDAASSPPPVWITTVTDAVLATLPGRILFSVDVDNDKAAADDDFSESNEIHAALKRMPGWSTWRVLGRILDFICFFAYFSCFIVLLISYLLPIP